MNSIAKKIQFKFLTTTLLIFVFSLTAWSNPKDKKTEHEKQRFNADAAAVAYINCKYDLAKYYSSNKPDDKQLQKELADVDLLRLQFNNQIVGKYRTPVEQFEEFTKAVEVAKPKLKTCIKYQNILLANEKLKKNK